MNTTSFIKRILTSQRKILKRMLRIRLKSYCVGATRVQASEPFPTAFVRLQGGWFGPAHVAPDVPLDTSILTQSDLAAYVNAYQRTGFFGVDSLYMNDADNVAYADEAVNNGVLEMPVLFLPANYDYINDTEGTNLMNPMKEKCRRLTINKIESGHWMQHERAVDVNNVLARWIATNVPSTVVL